jgi:hypothetical protein
MNGPGQCGSEFGTGMGPTRKSRQLWNPRIRRILLAGVEGLEPPTPGFGVRLGAFCSVLPIHRSCCFVRRFQPRRVVPSRDVSARTTVLGSKMVAAELIRAAARPARGAIVVWAVGCLTAKRLCYVWDRDIGWGGSRFATQPAARGRLARSVTLVRGKPPY